MLKIGDWVVRKARWQGNVWKSRTGPLYNSPFMIIEINADDDLVLQGVLGRWTKDYFNRVPPPVTKTIEEIYEEM